MSLVKEEANTNKFIYQLGKNNNENRSQDLWYAV